MSRSSWARLQRRIWLPRVLYEALPWLYLGTGGAALAGGLFGSEGGWYYPYLALFGLAVLHGALWVATARYRWRRRQRLARRQGAVRMSPTA